MGIRASGEPPPPPSHVFLNFQVVERLVQLVVQRCLEEQAVPHVRDDGEDDEERPQLHHLLHQCGEGSDDVPSAAQRLRDCLGREAEGIMDAVLHLVLTGGGHEHRGGQLLDWQDVMRIIDDHVSPSPVEAHKSLPPLKLNQAVAARIRTRLHRYFRSGEELQPQSPDQVESTVGQEPQPHIEL